MAMMGSGYERRPEPEAPAGPRLRVYELAKDLNVQPKDMLNKIRAMGIDVANHMSHLESVDVDRVRRAVERERLENLEEVPQRHRHPPPLKSAAEAPVSSQPRHPSPHRRRSSPHAARARSLPRLLPLRQVSAPRPPAGPEVIAQPAPHPGARPPPRRRRRGTE
jgi:translation initiation factor IF-2